MRAVLPVMRRQRSGHIINISSVAGVVGQAAVAAYGASKFAVEGLSLAVAKEVERFGIKVTVVEPGFFRTGLLDPSRSSGAANTLRTMGPRATSRPPGRSTTVSSPMTRRHLAKRWSRSPAWSTRRRCSPREATPSTRSPPLSRVDC